MRVLIACEFSGIVRDAFIKRGHDAVSCDLLPSERLGPHIQDDVLKHLDDGWDMMIAHPPCTYIANSGVHWLNRRPERWSLMREGALFFRQLWEADIPRICNENPIPHHYALDIIRANYSQIIQPYQYGENASKATYLWLKNLPPLKPTKFIEPIYRCPCGGRPFEYSLGKYGCPNCLGEQTARAVWGNQTPTGQNKLGPSTHRQADRSRTFQGIADAMAAQWGSIPTLPPDSGAS